MERYEKYKDSGVEWIGEIPEGWEVKKLKFIVSNLESGVSVNSTDYPVTGHAYGILKTSCVYNYVFDPNENKEIWQSELNRAKVNPRKGEIIISRMNTPDLVGASGYVDKDYGNLFLPDRLWQTTFIHHIEIDTKWLSFVLKSTRFRMLLSITATGTIPSMKNLTQEDFLNIVVPFPSVEDQTAVVQHIETETARINAKIAKTKKIIALQKEYRTALISEVVTGKIKVTQEAVA
ncbi:MAG: restriction endonuclease subunit S [Desulfuromusa sp.]|nr:restriction endonuclease subunit S [Desulfuromusa sp.]